MYGRYAARADLVGLRVRVGTRHNDTYQICT